MTAGDWTIVVVLAVGLYGVLWSLERIYDRLGQILDIVHRIRINDRDRGF